MITEEENHELKKQIVQETSKGVGDQEVKYFTDENELVRETEWLFNKQEKEKNAYFPKYASGIYRT